MCSYLVAPLSSVQLLRCVWLFATPWTAAHQASLSITNSQSLPKLMSIESEEPSNNLILSHPISHLQYFPASGSFQMSQLFTSGGQILGVSDSTSLLPINIQGCFPLGWTGWISLQSKGLSRVFSNTTVQKHQFFGTHFSLTSIHEYWKNHSLDKIDLCCKVMSLLFNMLSKLFIDFLRRSKHLLISWLQSPSAVILEPPKIKAAMVSTVSPSICHEMMGKWWEHQTTCPASWETYM